MTDVNRKRIANRFGVQATPILALAALCLGAAPALAHHPLGGATPTTFLHGFLSGVGHPVIGVDHFAFVVAVGLACALVSARLALPALFVAATFVGCLLTSQTGAIMPQNELAIAGSIIAIGAIVMSGRSIDERLLATLLGVAGILHGSAYAGAIVGAEATPLVAYLLGFAAVQFAIVIAAMAVTLGVWKAAATSALQPRLAGAVIAGVGGTFFIEKIEAMAFPGM